MAIELGHFALVLAVAMALVTAGLGLTLWRGAAWVTGFARQAAILQFVLVGIAFAALIQAFAVSDFSLALAFENSHSDQPLIYKITSTWGNHEGSILLWVFILTLFGGAVAAFGRNLPRDLLTLALAMQSLLVAAFGGFALFTSNPFARLNPVPIEGRDLNPILQDIGLAIHPPLLYVGYVGFSVCFSFAVAALISGRIDAAWARWVRPWTLASWLFLTLGIAMGSYWAYYELGWGGWWFWDPVENASFMPWLAGTALLHSALVMEKRGALKIWTIFLAIITFSLSLLGTFLVRSGILTSVHSFASDPTRGIVILSLLAAVIGGAFVLFAWRAPALSTGGLFAPVSREGALVLNNLFLATATAAVLVGTLYPLVLDAATGMRISVGAPFFNLTFSILMTPLLVVMPFGPFLAWKRGDLLAVTGRLAAAVAVALAATVIAFLLSGFEVPLAALGFFLGFWVMIGALADLADRVRAGRIPPGDSFRRLAGLPRSAWSTAIAHFGLGMSVIGIVCASSFSTENITTLHRGEATSLSGYSVTLASEQSLAGPNYDADRITLSVTAPGGMTRDVSSEKRVYRASSQPTTEAGILTYGLSQLYIAVGDPSDGGHVVRIWYKPFVLLIWLGAVVMAMAGALSLTDRRLRIGAPARKRHTAGAVE
ncbi:MAG: heme lyase CcmF/NrfE family subunit [Alphaproteobacteria bacterium]|nr:heme lyase CcmF/NrfE family subunit [Alphaproteobacteria bacterium]